MWKICVLFTFVAAINLKNAYAATAEEREAIFKSILPVAVQCAEELGIDGFDIAESKISKIVDPCFMACILAKNGVLKDGYIAADVIEERMKSFLHDADEIEKLGEIRDACATEANESTVPDGDSECKRAGIFMFCLRDKKAEINIEP